MSPTHPGRRGFLAALASAPLGALAQPARRPRVAVISQGTPSSMDDDLRKRVESGLAGNGIPAIEYRVFFSPDDSVPGMDAAAREAVAWSPDAILAPGPIATMAAQKATRTVPVIFFSVPDPVEFGFAQSSSRPGGNLTGSAWDGASQTLKRLELGREMLPRAKTVLAVYRQRPGAFPGLLTRVRTRFKELAAQLGLEAREEDVAEGGRGLRATLAAAARRPPHLLVGFGPYDWEPDGEADSIATLLDFERRTGALSVHESREAVERGGIVGIHSTVSTLAPALVVLSKVLKGTPPAVVPVEYGAKYTIVVNSRAARARGIVVPDSIRVRAEDVVG